jgi:cytoskeleton protein RodZ
VSKPLADERDGTELAAGSAVQAGGPTAGGPPSGDGAAAAVGDETGFGGSADAAAPSSDAGAASVSTEAAEPSAPAGPTPGEQLRAERQRQGLSVGEVARQLKLATRQVEALERDDHASLPGSIFVRGFLRNYARALGLDADALVRKAFGETDAPPAAGPAAGATPAPLPSPLQDKSSLNVPVESGVPRRRGAAPWIAAGAVLAVAAVAAVVLLAGRGPATPSSTEVAIGGAGSAAIPPPADTPPAAASPEASPEAAPAREDEASLASARSAPVAPVAEPSNAVVIGTRGPEMLFRFSRESWVEIRDGDGRVIFSQLNPEGSERVVRGKPPLELVVGNASGVALAYRGKSVDLGPHTRSDVARLTLE